MQTGELKGQIDYKLGCVHETRNKAVLASTANASAEYLSAQADLSSYLAANAQEIIDKLVKLTELERIGTALIAYPDKRGIPGQEWESLREALGIQP